ncbi:glycosyltransferase [Micromonospora sp. CPCC 205561]|uniref:glycosyltransferase n=1 Tax=Micromonospora sp. CPCC 205561 TaxID=3122407 RepID=UPI002FF3CDA2
MVDIVTGAPTASVVIPARNAVAVLEGQLAALRKQEFDGRFEVIVADNGSTDDTAAVAVGWADRIPGLQVVDASARPGISHARNTGVAAAGGEYVLFCDADDEASPGWVQAMVDGLKQADVVGGRLDLDTLNPPRVRAWRVDPALDRLPTTMDFLPYAIGANIGVRTAVYRALGGFNEAYRGSHDDVEFCWRAQLASYRLGYVPQAVIRYRLRGDLRRLAAQRYGYGLSYAQLFRQYQDLEITSGGVGTELRIWVGLLLQIPQMVTCTGRGRWIYQASWNAGRLRGSLRHRTLCPR